MHTQYPVEQQVKDLALWVSTLLRTGSMRNRHCTQAPNEADPDVASAHHVTILPVERGADKGGLLGLLWMAGTLTRATRNADRKAGVPQSRPTTSSRFGAASWQQQQQLADSERMMACRPRLRRR